MKIYLLLQTDNNDWNTFDSCVVCAENEEDARTITPSSEYDSWAISSKSITCKEIGIANENQKRGVIIASFNAG